MRRYSRKADVWHQRISLHVGASGGARLRAAAAILGTYEGLSSVLVLPWNEKYEEEHLVVFGLLDRRCRHADHQYGDALVKVRWGLIGTGRIAASYGEAFGKTKNAQLVAVADVQVEAAREFAERFGCRAYGSYEAMIANDRIDAIVICTPPLWHESIAVDCMERGYHVLCEKPLAITLDSAYRMADVARRTGVVFTMASKFRYVPDVMRAHQLITEGAIGDVILFENSFTSRVSMSGRWNADPVISGGGVLIDNGTHSVDIMRYFLGPVDVVKAVAGRRVQDLDVEDTVHLFAISESGVMGNVDLSWSIDKQTESYLRLYGSKGTISVGWRSSAYKRVG